MHAIVLDSFGVYADDTTAVTTFMSGMDCHTGKHLADLLNWRHHPDVHVVAALAGRSVTVNNLPDPAVSAGDVAALEWDRTTLPAIAEALSLIGACETEPDIVWRDDGGKSFASNGNLIDTIHITQPVAFYRVNQPTSNYTVVTHLFSLPAGGYTIAWTGRYRLHLADIGYTTTDPPDFYDAAEALSCTTATAACHTCATVWTAHDGATTFTPASDCGITWRIGDTDPADDNTVACPAIDCDGQVGFTITT